MAILDPEAGLYLRIREELAAIGIICVAVDFRSTILNHAPFPAGLNDCASAVKWVNNNKAKLNVSKIVVAGDSGGGNLALATTLKLKSDNIIDGTYAFAPFISNLYNKQEEAADLPSLVENDGYDFRVSTIGILADPYTLPGSPDERNPLAWPYWASENDLKGFPPTVITVNELDPLRDEGLAFDRKLRQAGVKGYSRNIPGTIHVGDLCAVKIAPDIFKASLHDLLSFCRGL